MLETARGIVRHCAHMALFTWAAVGCAGTEVPAVCNKTEAIKLHVHPTARLNPDRAGLPRSVVLRLYQLDDVREFRASPFERLWSNEGRTRPEQLIALPGQDREHALRRDPNARYLAIAANFRERNEDTDWRALVRLPEPRDPCRDWPGARIAPLELVLERYSLHLR
ncbi:MAG: type VI secretion system lipoprotein TssJ [Polyangiales bacterium]